VSDPTAPAPIDPPAFSLAGRVAVVTGGASGIGAAIVRRFRAAGAQVLVGDVVDDEAARAATEALGGTHHQVDVAREDEVEALLGLAVTMHGRLDIVVNNAGAALEGVPLTEESTARMLRLFRVNTLGVLYGTKHAAKVMTGGGAVVNIGSLASDLAWAENTAYAVSKSGVVALTRTAAVELAASGIRVNAVCPSMIETPMVAHDTPGLNAERRWVTSVSAQARVGTADEVAAAAHFLASPDCGYLTGQVLTLDGGLSAGPSPSALGL
jgi:NAD(P)-dependent dehydrogenase (short-subunit alcohol dehydrogenase family)